MKTIQIRTKYAPWLSNSTKHIMKDRDQAQKIALTHKFSLEFLGQCSTSQDDIDDVNSLHIFGDIIYVFGSPARNFDCTNI